MLKGLLEQRCVGTRCPDAARPIAVPVAGAIDEDDAEALGEVFDEAAAQEVLDHGAVTMDEH